MTGHARQQAGARTYVKGAIQPRQIKAIHAVKNTLGMDDGDYRAMLQSSYGVTSSKKLTWRQAEDLLDDLNRKAGRPTVKQQSASGKLKYADMDGRPGFATGAQLRLVDAMFRQITRAEGDAQIFVALNSFCSRIAGVAGIRMVRRYQVEKIVKALEAMGAVKKEGN